MLLLVIDCGERAVVWVAVYAARETVRRICRDVAYEDATLCAVCTALELLREVGDAPADAD